VAQLTSLVRPMTAADIEVVSGLERDIFPDPWSARAFAEELAAEGRFYLVCQEGRQVVGYAGMLVVGEDAHVVTLGVAAGRRRHGLGTLLVLRLAEHALGAGAVNLTLEVRADNEDAQSLYRRFGFVPIGVRRRYYRDEDALIMWAIDIDSEEYRARLAAIGEGLR
jgi:ribosomal-protein-alanine N-acetyltransferase